MGGAAEPRPAFCYPRRMLLGDSLLGPGLCPDTPSVG